MVSTTWSVDSLQKDKIMKLLIEQTEAFTQGRNGSDSNNYFFKEGLFESFGPINNQNYEINTLVVKNNHKLLENGVIPVGFISNEVQF